MPGVAVDDAQIIWADESDPDGNTAHVAEHGLTPDEVDEVLLDPQLPIQRSRRSGLPCRFGWTWGGKYIIVIWEVAEYDPLIIVPVTAYEMPPPADGG